MKKMALIPLLATGLWLLNSSFTSRPGGEGFEIYADGTLLLQRFGNDMNQVQPLLLSGYSSATLYIKYFHCGKTGTGRVLTIKDDQGRVLKDFAYADSRAAQGTMALDLSSVKALVKDRQPVRLYYVSTELKNGRMLALITL